MTLATEALPGQAGFRSRLEKFHRNASLSLAEVIWQEMLDLATRSAEANASDREDAKERSIALYKKWANLRDRRNHILLSIDVPVTETSGVLHPAGKEGG